MEMIKSNEFQNTIANGYTLVDFFATWCGPCKMLAPVLEELSASNKDIKFVKVDVDECEDIAQEFGIMSIPTIILFKDGKAIAKTQGYQGAKTLQDFLNNNK